MTAQDVALKNEILRGVVGSTCHGINISGQDDHTLQLIEEAEDQLRSLVDVCQWESDTKIINRFLVEAHALHWQARHGTGWPIRVFKGAA